ncbi:MAG: hypothetical protein WDA75_03655 [Candidatus Latescibacterota bacterium]|jgi:hypothetical protein
MGTIGALAHRGRAFLLLSCDGAPVGLVWQRLPALGRWLAAGLVDGDRGVYAGVNEAGVWVAAVGNLELGEAVRRAAAEVLTAAASLAEAVSFAERLMVDNLASGCLGLAEGGQVALVEVVHHEPRTEVTGTGFFARSSPEPDEAAEDSAPLGEIRCERLTAFLEQLYAWLPALDEEDVAARCWAVLRQEPILNPRTRASLFADVLDRRVDLAIEDGPWQSLRLGTGD